MGIRRLVITLLAAAGAAGVHAEESVWDSLQIHGFASQGAVNTSANRFFGDSVVVWLVVIPTSWIPLLGKEGWPVRAGVVRNVG